MWFLEASDFRAGFYCDAVKRMQLRPCPIAQFDEDMDPGTQVSVRSVVIN